MRGDFAVNKHSFHFFFGYVQVNDKNEKNRLVDLLPKKQRSVVDFTEERRNFSLEQIKTYNVIKTAIWNCVIPEDETTPRNLQQVNLVLLRRLLGEIQSFIELYMLRLQVEGDKKHADLIEFGEKFKLKGSSFDDPRDTQEIQQILKRLRLLNPALLAQTIKNCVNQGLVSSQ